MIRKEESRPSTVDQKITYEKLRTNKWATFVFPSKLKPPDWLKYIVLTPALSQQYHRQNAYFSQVTLDSLLQLSFNLSDVHNLTLVTDTLQEKASFYSLSYNRNDSNIQTPMQILKNLSHGEEVQLESYFQTQTFNTTPDIKKKEDPAGIEKKCGVHLVQGYLSLRILKMREMKQKILYGLNYFRSIQRTLALDLREMGTRDRVMGDVDIVLPEEASSNTKSQNRHHATSASSINEELKRPLDQAKLIDFNQYKLNGRFINNLSATCPIIPIFHSTFGNPVERLE
jgi:hypothetical protein